MTDSDAAASEARPGPDDSTPRFMSVKQVASYLQVNDKKIYSLVREGKIPASKVTGKWLFPRDLVDQWVLESSHGGLLTDRMLIAGSDDPLLYRAVMQIANQIRARAMVSYTPTGTQLGLSLLARRRADMCGIHWGPVEESAKRHPALIKQFAQHHDWVLVRLFRREQGLILAPDAWPRGSRVEDLFSSGIRWAVRQEGAGSQRFLQEIITELGVNPAARRITGRAYSERDAASLVAMGQADVATGVRAAATEFGLEFLPIGWEAFDLAMHRGVFFRTLFQKLLDHLRGGDAQSLARMLGGYDMAECGNLIWPT